MPGSMLLTAEQYFESRRKHHQDHAQGEHAWLGDVTVSLPSLSCYNPHAVPWYVLDGMDHVTAGHASHDHVHVASAASEASLQVSKSS